MQKKGVFRVLLPYYKKYKWILVFDMICALLTTVCDMVFPMLVRYLTNMGLNDLQSMTVNTVLLVGGVYLLLRVLDVAANYFMQYTGHIMGAKIERDMRRDLFSHLQLLSNSYFDHTKIGQIMARITSDLFDVTEFSHHCPEEFFIGGVKLVAVFSILCTMNVWLTLIIFALIPLLMAFILPLNLRLRKAFKKSRSQTGEINAQVEDTLLGIKVVKSFGNEDIEREKFARGNEKYLAIRREMYRHMADFHSTLRIFEGIMYVSVVVAGALFMMNGAISPADYMTYLLYISTLLTAIRKLVEYTEQFQRGVTGVERFLEVMEEPVEITDEPDAVDLGSVEGNITFEDVSFHYSDSDENVLAHIDLEIPKGTSIALVGPSGAGKTTLCNLIPRFYDVTRGRVLMDGVDVRKATLASLRSNIGVVQQDVYLFSGTIFENIEYGRPGASREDVISAAKQAGAHDFIMQMPDGYDTYVGERGGKLSGGQKQRVSIARVFLKDPPVLILDEATSALDNESERLVQQSLKELTKGRTTLTIAHRLTTIKGADKILVLTEEGIAESGSHKELMEKGGIYAHLYEMYSDSME